MNRTYLFFLISLITITITSCSRSDRIILNQASSLIETDYDATNTLLDSLDVDNLSRSDKAKYCLLKSMVLDKQYIDLEEDTLIAPAVKFYKRHGSQDEKLKTSFYHARIKENIGDIDECLGILLKAEKYANRSKDHLFISRYYVKIGQIYGDSFNWKKSLDAVLIAAKHSRLVEDYRGLATALLSASTEYQLLGDNDNALICLSEVRNLWNNINDYRKGEYYRQLITLALKGHGESPDIVYSNCISELKGSSRMPFISLTDYAISKGDFTSAENYLDLAVSYGQVQAGTKEFELRNYKIKALQNDYMAAYNSYSQYNSEIENYTLAAILSDAKYLEERIESVKKQSRSTLLILSLSVLAITLIILTALTIQSSKRKQRAHEQMLDSLKKEKEQLELILSGGMILPSDVVNMLTSRIGILNGMILDSINGKLKHSDQSVKKRIETIASDRNSFLLSLAMVYTISNPMFIFHLKNHSLTDWEIGYCCLYVMGLNGKEIAGYVLTSNSYNISSTIRKKLGLSPHDTNLSLYLRRLSEQG